MFRSFLRLTFRSLWKDKFYSLINIFGLSLGITASVLILLWVTDEVSFDRFLPKGDRLQQVYVSAKFDGKINTWQSVPLPTYQAMKDADHRIVNSVVTGWGGDHLLTVDDTKLMIEGLYVSEEFLDMFQFPLVEGSGQEVLDDPRSIVLTESAARSLFNDLDPIGKTVRLDDEHDLRVSGILKDLPENSSFEFEYLLTWKFREQVNEWVRDNTTNWGNYSFQVFVEIAEEADPSLVEGQIRDMLTEHGEDDIERVLFFHPLTKWHLYGTFENGQNIGGQIDYVRLFTTIAILILIIACINFMNLATARSENRTREVGVRKSVGARRSQIITQFLGESIIISGISFVLGLLLVFIFLGPFNQLVDKQLSIDVTSPLFWLGSLLLILLTGLLAGSYPAIYLSSFSPSTTLKGGIKVGRGADTPRKVLVVLQFGFAVLLTVAAMVVYQQITLVQDRDLGYDQSNLVNFRRNDQLDEKYEVLKNELLQEGLIEAMTRSNSRITSINSNNFVGWPGKPEDQRVIFTTITTEYDYAQTYDITMVEGRDFSREFPTDTQAIIINKAALELMNLEDPIGTQLDLWGEKRTLIGVIDNVLMGSLFREVKPLFMIIEDWGGVLTARLRPQSDIQKTLAQIEQVFAKHNPAYPFEYSFVDTEYQEKFASIRLTQRLASIFTLLALIITGLGLLGLASYMATQRTKEIGIRKVLGASVTSLVALLSKDFTKLVLLAILIAAPVTWWLLDNYLDRYPIRVPINAWVFLLVGTLILLLTWIIVGSLARRAALSNPVNSLRDM